MDLFPVKYTGDGFTSGWQVLLASILMLAVNAIIWVCISFVLAWGAAKGWAAAS